MKNRIRSIVLPVAFAVAAVLSLFKGSASAEDSCRLYLDVSYEGNFLFSNYDVDILLDFESKPLGTIHHGEYFTRLVEDVSPGHHYLVFSKSGDGTVNGLATLEISSDSTITCRIRTGIRGIRVDEFNMSEGIEGSSLTVPDLKESFLVTALSEIAEDGFVNVHYRGESGDSVWDTGSWIVTSQSLEPGTVHDKTDEIILKCVQVSDFIDDVFAGLTYAEAVPVAEEHDLTVKYSSAVTSAQMNSFFKEADWKVKEEWIVSGGTGYTPSKREIRLFMKYTGDVEMPDVEGMDLDDAIRDLKNLEFSNIKEKSEDGSVILFKNRWDVVSQSIPAGSMVKATEEIVLTAAKPQKEKHGSVPETGTASEPEAEPKHEMTPKVTAVPTSEPEATPEANAAPKPAITPESAPTPKPEKTEKPLPSGRPEPSHLPEK